MRFFFFNFQYNLFFMRQIILSNAIKKTFDKNTDICMEKTEFVVPGSHGLAVSVLRRRRRPAVVATTLNRHNDHSIRSCYKYFNVINVYYFLQRFLNVVATLYN